VAKAFALTPVIVDSGIIYALMDRSDVWHQRVADYLRDFIGKLIVPITVVPEACYLLNTFLGPAAERAFLTSLTKGEFAVEPCSPADLSRCLTILEHYADANLGLVDASVMAIAERLKITKILTCDRSHFSLFRPKHCTGFELYP
jgi:hypothetical protein